MKRLKISFKNICEYCFKFLLCFHGARKGKDRVDDAPNAKAKGRGRTE